MANLPREYVEDISIQRMQENIARKFNSQNEQFIGCMGGTQTSLGNNSWRIAHSLKREPKGFVLLTQTTAGSIFTKMINQSGTTADLVFDSNPGTFTVFFF